MYVCPACKLLIIFIYFIIYCLSSCCEKNWYGVCLKSKGRCDGKAWEFRNDVSKVDDQAQGWWMLLPFKAIDRAQGW